MMAINLNEVLQFCDAAEALLAAHADDIKLHGAARPQAQCEFAQRAYGALEEACERIRKLAAEVEWLQERVSPPPMLCGHPRACVVSADDDRDSTGHCAWCEDSARWRGLLEVAADNAEGFREMLVECERETAGLKADAKLSTAKRVAMVSEMGWDAEVEIAELKAELVLMQGKASSRGGKP